MEFIPGDPKKSMGERGLTFDMIRKAPFLDFIDNQSAQHAGQRILVVEIDGYAVAVPCKKVADGEWMMVTAFRSRKLTKRYLREP